MTPGRRWRRCRRSRRWRGRPRTARGRCPPTRRRAAPGRSADARASSSAATCELEDAGAASTVIRSPSRTRASGPPSAASGVRWMAAGTLPGRAGHPAVGDDRDPLPAVLEHAERRGELVQLGHAVGGRALVADHRDEVPAVELAGLEGGQEVGLVVEDDRRRGDTWCSALDRRGLDDARVPRLPVEHLQAAVGGERVVGRAQHVEVERCARGPPPSSSSPSRRAAARWCSATGPRPAMVVHVVVQQPGLAAASHQEAHAAGGVEVVHVGLAVGVDPGQQRHHRRQVGEVVPGQHDAGGAGDRDQVQRVVGRAAGGEQRDAGVDDRLLVDDLADRRGARRPAAVISVARRPAASVSASRSGVPGLTKDEPGRCRPSTSISSWLELAVP